MAFLEFNKYSDLGRWQINKFVRSAATKISHGTLVLDVGAGECAYQSLFQHCKYVGVDWGKGDESWDYSSLSAFASVYALPFKDNTFGAVLCTQTIEHVNGPQGLLNEIFRVLKKDGTLFLTGPMAHEEHQQPYDYFRFTSFGMMFLCEKAGFSKSQVAIVPFGGRCFRWAYELSAIPGYFPKRGPGITAMLKWVCGIPFKVATIATIRLLQVALVCIDRDESNRYPFGWGVIAIRNR